MCCIASLYCLLLRLSRNRFYQERWQREKAQGNRGKKVQKTSSFLSIVKRMFIGAFIVVACFIGGLFIYDYFVPMAGHKPVALEKKGQEVVFCKKGCNRSDTKDTG